mmetsp:Transcript_15918/g.53272  ORF Transcript_15918/g.53272 Transcript_15918/m.53272 type:complete len:103 (-) Transcript_15918:125-433(-)
MALFTMTVHLQTYVRVCVHERITWQLHLPLKRKTPSTEKIKAMMTGLSKLLKKRVMLYAPLIHLHRSRILPYKIWCWSSATQFFCNTLRPKNNHMITWKKEN